MEGKVGVLVGGWGGTSVEVQCQWNRHGMLSNSA